MRAWQSKLVLGLALLGCAVMANAQEPPKPVAGTVSVPSYEIPPSAYLSPEARALQEKGTQSPVGDTPPTPQQILGIRAGMQKARAPLIEAMRAEYGVTLEKTIVGGISGYWVRPNMPAQKGKRPILLNLPAGGFMIGQANPIGLIEAIPVASRSGYDVLTIDYRQYPEAVFPAASADVAKVYRELLKMHKPSQIGIYGCSAGGLLTAQSLAWFDKQALPFPGAAGVLCASADGFWQGDSWYWQKPIQGKPAAPTLDEERYYGGHDATDPLLSPVLSEKLLAKFPPTLLMSATRAGELSATVDTHRRLVRNGVEAELHVWDGLGHAFMFMHPQLPESREAHTVIANFFRTHLTGKRSK